MMGRGLGVGVCELFHFRTAGELGGGGGGRISMSSPQGHHLRGWRKSVNKVLTVHRNYKVY